MWDQSLRPNADEEKNPPNGYRMGVEFTEEQINRALEADSSEERRRMVPSQDISGHGTAVAGIAAGNGRGSGNLYAGVAPDCSKNGIAYARRSSTDDRTDAGDGLCGEESTGISDAGGDQSEFWKYIWFS